ncbi:MAG: M48 family metalloprotease [Cyanobacteria bacterium J06638_20]
MVEFRDDSNSNHQAGVPSLERGLAALQRKQYSEAIVHLEPLASDRDRRTQTRAQMGLVQAYAAQGQRDAAIALCQTLTQSPAANVRQWAENIQQQLQTSGKPPSNTTPANHQAAAPTEARRSTTDFDDLTASLTYRKSSKPTPAQPSVEQPTEQPPVPAPTEPPVTEAVSTTEPPVTEAASTNAASTDAESVEAPEPTPTTSPIHLPPASETVAPSPNATASTNEASTNEVEAEEPEEAVEEENDAAEGSESVESESADGETQPLLWTQAGRADRGRSLGATDRAKLLAVEGLTVVLLTGILWAIAQLTLTGYNAIITGITLPFLSLSRWALYIQTFWWIAGFVAVGVLLAPWFWLWRMRQGAKVQKLDVKALEARSPETVRLLQRFMRKHGGKFQVQCLPITAPLIFSYGHWLSARRIVLSQGLFDQLNDDEIAVLVAAELAHVRLWDGAILSGVAALLQLPYALYRWAATWGDRHDSQLVRIPAVILSVLGYGVFWTGRLAGLWLSRVRLYYSDRAACELTGNPNGLTRALLKVAIGNAQWVMTQEETPHLLEQLDLLTPVGCQEALILGSLYPSHPGSELLEWGRSNPHHRWLAMLEAHPALGDRLHRLALIAQKWRLPQELTFSDTPICSKRSWQRYRPLLIQALPFIGLIIGLLVGQGFWWFGIYAERLRSISLDWLRNDFIHLTCMAIGLGIGTFLRLNPFFPEVKHINNLPAGDLPDLLRSPDAMPAQRQSLRFQGTLIGRRGLANAIAQDLFLKTEEGLLRLHFLPFFSFSDNPIAGWRQLQGLLHKTVMVSGWFRRGVTPWLDLNSLHTQTGKALRSGHPLWAAAIGIIAVLWGCFKILTGDI